MRACGWSSVPASAAGAHAARPAPARASHRGQHVGVHLLGRAVGVDPPPAPRVGGGQPLVGGAHARLEPAPSSSKRSASPARAAAAAGSSSSRKVRSGASPPVANALTPRHLVDPEPARLALVGERGVEEAVGDHDRARSSAGRITRATSSARAAANSSASASRADLDGGVLQQVAHALADLGAARLAHRERVVAERLAQQPGLGGLPRAVDSLEGDEQAAHAAKVATAPGVARRTA